MKWQYLHVTTYKEYVNDFIKDLSSLNKFKASLVFPDNSLWYIPLDKFLDTHTLKNDLGEFGWELIATGPGVPFPEFNTDWEFKRSVTNESEPFFDEGFRSKWFLQRKY